MIKTVILYKISIAVLMGIVVFHISSSTSKAPLMEERSDNSEMCFEKHKNVKRIGMVIKIKPEKLEEYLELHADTNAGVRHLLSKYNMRNFSIFMTQLEDGNHYEFGYWEYWGDDYEADMRKIEGEPENKAWLALCDPMQVPLEGESSWRQMERIYFNY